MTHDIQKLIEFYKYPELTCRSYHGDVTDDTIQALEELAALREKMERMGAPEGWQLVPYVPTREMIAMLLVTMCGDEFDDIEVIEAWQETLDAAPMPPENDDDDA